MPAMIRSRIYDSLILRLTSGWYAAVLTRLPTGSHMLDVGIGTAGALLANANLIKDRQLQVTGIDIDADYVERALKRLQSSTIAQYTAVHRESIYDHQGGPYDVVYFSASFMLLPNPEQALHHCCELLKPDGRIVFTQTMHKQRSAWTETLKPMLRRLTSIDFGRVTYEDDFRKQIAVAGLTLEEFTFLERHATRDYCLAVATPGKPVG